jgi:hypothetical protein
MPTKTVIFYLYAWSVLLIIIALVVAIISLASRSTNESPLLFWVLIGASMIALGAALGLASLDKRVSELERQRANSDQESGTI